MKKFLAGLVIMLLLAVPCFGGQGDTIWTRSNVSAYQVAGDGGSALTITFPQDSNAQPVVMSYECKGINAADEVVWYVEQDTGTKKYTTLSQAYCGGTTNYVHMNADISGASIYVVSYGGYSAYYEPNRYQDSNLTAVVVGKGTGPRSGISTFAVGAAIETASGTPDLSGVTFPIGSRVSRMKPLARQLIANTTVAKENETGLFAAQRGSPLLGYFENVGSSAAFKIHYVTVKYE